MTSHAIRRAKLARKLGVVLILAGLAAIAWLVAATLNPVVPSLPSIDSLEPLRRAPWVPNPSMLLFALAGLAVIWLGSSIIVRQKAVFEADRRETEDRLRRVREYGSEGRIEPYIGSPMTFENDKEPS